MEEAVKRETCSRPQGQNAGFRNHKTRVEEAEEYGTNSRPLKAADGPDEAAEKGDIQRESKRGRRKRPICSKAKMTGRPPAEAAEGEK